jgi:D-aminoacyl-tRNA deacylase
VFVLFLHLLLGVKKLPGYQRTSALAGLVCFVGLKAADAAQDAEMIINKVLNARVFHCCETGKSWASSVCDVGGELLLVSQFTLYGRLKSKSPDFTRSMKSTDVHLHPLHVTIVSW